VDAADTMFEQNAEVTKSPYLLIIGAIGIIALGKWWFTGKVLGAEYTTQDGFDADFESKHFWK
jgi:hypothetical protein